jgi:hypothetical protein
MVLLRSKVLRKRSLVELYVFVEVYRYFKCTHQLCDEKNNSIKQMGTLIAIKTPICEDYF